MTYRRHSSASTWLACLAVVAGLGVGVPEANAVADHASARHCLGEGRPRAVIHQTFGGTLGPIGLENQLRAGFCVPLIEKPGILFDYTNIEVGLVNHLSPAYVFQGAYLALTPISPLVLRAEWMAVGLWKSPFAAAAYHPLSGYDASFTVDDMPWEAGQPATGQVIRLGVTLRASVDVAHPAKLPGPIAIVGFSDFMAERWIIGSESHYYQLRNDVILARADWDLINTAALLLQLPITQKISLRVGVVDDLAYVPASKVLNHGLGGGLMLNVVDWGPARDFSFVVMVAQRLAHPYRRGLPKMTLGFIIDWGRPRGR